MSDASTLARPYAQAVFRQAQEENDLAGWSERLQRAAAVAADPTMQAVIRSPRVGREEAARVMIEVCGEALGQEGANLVRLLAENRRLALLPAIAERYEALRAEAEGRIEAELISAGELDQEAHRRISEALARRLGRRVTLHCRTDPDLLAGAVVRAGDLVIDGSLRGRLRKLAGVLH